MTAISTFLPLSVRGTSGTWRILAGTCRGVQLVRMRVLIVVHSSSSSSLPGAQDDKEDYAHVISHCCPTTSASTMSSRASTCR